MVLFKESWLGALSFILLLLLALPTDALPKRKSKSAKAKGGASTRASTGATTSGSITKATNRSTILDKTITINGLSIRYKVSGPASAFTAASGVPGTGATATTNGTAGLNVLLHGDGGTSFDFPNQAVQSNLIGVVVLTPDPNLF